MLLLLVHGTADGTADVTEAVVIIVTASSGILTWGNALKLCGWKIVIFNSQIHKAAVWHCHRPYYPADKGMLAAVHEAVCHWFCNV
jgi:hypothetical protein